MSTGKKVGLIVAIMLVVICTVIGSITVIGQAKNSKYQDNVDMGIKYVLDGDYESAILAFEKAIKIDDKKPEAEEYVKLINTYMELEKAYENGDFDKVAQLIEKINGMNNSNLFSDKVSNIADETDNKVSIMGEIDGLEEKINSLISNKAFDEALNILNEYLAKDLTDDYKQKVNGLIEEVNQAKA